jgi:chromosomal replication initiator protein
MGTSLNNIGMFFGGRDHTTVLHALKTVKEKKSNDVRMEKMITSIRKELGFSFL